jgi:hypothetical protein
MADMTKLYGRIARTLLSPAAVKIDFWVHGMHVNFAGFLMVFAYIAAGYIQVRLAPRAKNVPSAKIPDWAEAIYEPSSNTLWFLRDNYGSEPTERMAIIHESTHALRDIMSSSAFRKQGMYGSVISGQSKFQNEAAAYVAAALFYLYENNQSAPGENSEIGIYDEANDLAARIAGKRGARLDLAAIQNLIINIASHPGYGKDATMTTPDVVDGI